MKMMLGGLYLRAKRDGERVRGPYPALASDHPLIDTHCAACAEPFKPGQRSALVVLGPDNAEDREKWNAGRWVSAVAAPLHAECAGCTGPEVTR